MNVTILTVGRLKERYFSAAVTEYLKRLKAYGKTNLIEVKEESFRDSLSPAMMEQVKTKEASNLERRLPKAAYVVALDVDGIQMSSDELAAFLQERALTGQSHIAFVIGGSLGLPEAFKERCDFRLSFSKMTFPHQLMQVILVEQIYRAFTINRGEKYHK